MSWQLVDPNESRGPDKAAAIGCLTVAVALLSGSIFAGVEVFVRRCQGSPHGCGFILLGGGSFLVLAVLCAAAAYWLYPKTPMRDRDQAT